MPCEITIDDERWVECRAGWLWFGETIEGFDLETKKLRSFRLKRNERYWNRRVINSNGMWGKEYWKLENGVVLYEDVFCEYGWRCSAG